jgi:hypothetical protein
VGTSEKYSKGLLLKEVNINKKVEALMKKLRNNNQINNNLPNQKFKIILEHCCNNKLHINKAEFILLNDAMHNHNCEIIEPANDNTKAMETIVSLYNKKLIKIDIENDRLFVSELGKKIFK